METWERMKIKKAVEWSSEQGHCELGKITKISSGKTTCKDALQALNGDICLIKWGIDTTLPISTLHPVALVQDLNSFKKCIA